MMLLYPSRGIIDAWASLGNEGWNFDALEPYFRKFGTVHAPPQSARDIVGLTYHDEKLAAGDGPVHISFSEGYGPNNKAWMDTFSQLGLEVSRDPRSGQAMGAFQQPATIDPTTKTRSYAATAYYSPEVAKRTNLVVLTETTVTKVILDTGASGVVATGVEIITKDGQRKQLSAQSEVVLAAGAMQSSQILELSGIGNPEILQKHGIPVIFDNPGVGENMQDHPIVGQCFEVKEGVISSDILRDQNVLGALVAMYQDGGQGPLGQSNISVAYTPVMDGSGVLSADATRTLIAPHEASIISPSAKTVRALIESPKEPALEFLLFPGQTTPCDDPAGLTDLITPSAPENYLTIMTILNHPFSRGSIHIASSDVASKPVWDPAYNTNPLDMEILARAVQFVEKIVDPSTPFGSLLQPSGKRIPNVDGHDLEGGKEIVRQAQVSIFHPTGSCAMLPREQGGVVDNRLRVHGIKGLRVVDASIFPLEPSGNIQGTVYAVAERAADILKEDRARPRL
jgi:choline dehydrogenase-like flavoprotein